MRTPLLWSACLLVLGACATEPTEGVDVAPAQASSLSLVGSTDPVDHLRALAAPEMEGRGTPSAGLERAGDYIIAECIKAGLKGALPGVGAESFVQPFTFGLFPRAPEAAPPEGSLLAAAPFGTRLFEEGIFLSGIAAPETRREMGKELCAALVAAGQPCPASTKAGVRDPRAQMSAVAQQTHNVVALLSGSGPHRDEVVVLSAHLDHLGTGPSGTFAGADDNGSGSAALVALMHTLATRNETDPLDRTIAFLWTAGEEEGLVGAAFFVDNTPSSIPVANIKQVVNLDMVGRWSDTRFSIGTDGSAPSSAASLLVEAANAEMPRPFSRVNRDVQQFVRRQDGHAFTRRGIPALFIFEGLSNPAGGGRLMADYHRRSDTVAALIADNGGRKLRRITQMLARAVPRIVNALPQSP